MEKHTFPNLFNLNSYWDIRVKSNDHLEARISGTVTMDFRRGLADWEPRLRITATYDDVTVCIYDAEPTKALEELWEDMTDAAHRLQRNSYEKTQAYVLDKLKGQPC